MRLSRVDCARRRTFDLFELELSAQAMMGRQTSWSRRTMTAIMAATPQRRAGVAMARRV